MQQIHRYSQIAIYVRMGPVNSNDHTKGQVLRILEKPKSSFGYGMANVPNKLDIEKPWFILRTVF
jgi:hypothetical protein